MKQTVMVVDDSRMNVQIATDMLKNRFNVVSADSGMTALKLLTTCIPDLILLDIYMPQMDGFEFIDELYKNQEYKNVPVIMMTSDDNTETEVRGFQAGVMDFITKPFIMEIAMKRIDRILELSRLQKKLKEEVKLQTQKVQLLSEEVMQTLANTIDAKDTYTNGHSIRVATYAKMIAQKYGKSEDEQQMIYYMGLLHDIGKIGVPDGIINKPSKLTDEEFGFIKQHPSIGSDILKTIHQIPEIMVGARWHHERYDGHGYPDGLSGFNIPEYARIIGVADAYDAMTSKRSYRDTLSQNIVRSEIEKGSGTQFDPKFAEIMLQLIDADTTYELCEVNFYKNRRI